MKPNQTTNILIASILISALRIINVVVLLYTIVILIIAHSFGISQVIFILLLIGVGSVIEWLDSFMVKTIREYNSSTIRDVDKELLSVMILHSSFILVSPVLIVISTICGILTSIVVGIYACLLGIVLFILKIMTFIIKTIKRLW